MKLPSTDSKHWEMFSLDDLKGPIPSFAACRRCAQKLIEEQPRMVRAVNSICVRADGTVRLVTFYRGRDGFMAHRDVWNFGVFTHAEFVGGLSLT